MKSDKVYLSHIKDAIKDIETFTARINKKEFRESKLIQSAVIRQIEIIGEATKNLSNAIKSKYGDIPWKDIAGMRDMLIHEYFGVDLEAVWRTVTEDIPKLKKQLVKMK
jgi:uncharacterized protein with HEPN domain